MDSFERFPPKGKFYSTLSEDSITDEEFIFAFHVYKKYECRIIGDYFAHLQMFLRISGVRAYNTMVEIPHYLSVPNFAFDAMLKRRMLNSS